MNKEKNRMATVKVLLHAPGLAWSIEGALTTARSESSYGIPVFVPEDDNDHAYGPGEFIDKGWLLEVPIDAGDEARALARKFVEHPLSACGLMDNITEEER